jgi:DNA end-binding protein Ku
VPKSRSSGSRSSGSRSAGSRSREARQAERREPEGGQPERRPRPFWSGTLAFGLVSIPVGLYPALRPPQVRLRMLDPEGNPVGRRYFPADGDGTPLDPEEIVRGYQVEDDRFVTVEDDELDALAPEKSQEMELSRFVEVAEIDPALFDRGYVLAPERGALRAYRLLADAMERSGRAGIATAVMRGKEYLVAIVAEGGLLRAETLRFVDELRRPEDVGLPALEEPGEDDLQRVDRAAARLERARLDPGWLEDRGGRRLLELVERKLASGEDVQAAPTDAADDEEDDATAAPIDLMEVLKRSLERDDEEA